MYTVTNWSNRDPIQEQGGLNLYAMVQNNPLDYWDYLGMSNCGKSWWDEAIDKAKEAAGWVYEKATGWHFEGRDARNDPLPTSESDILKNPEGWREESRNAFHDDGDPHPEKKYIHEDGREAIYDGKTGDLVTSDKLKGTYNYVNPGDYSGGLTSWPEAIASDIGHTIVDVIPALVGGNVRGKH